MRTQRASAGATVRADGTPGLHARGRFVPSPLPRATAPPTASTAPPVEPPTTPPTERRPGLGWVKPALVAVDVLTTALGLLVASVVYWLALGHLPDGAVLAVVSLPLWPVFYAHQSLYQARRVASRLEEFRRLVNATLAGTLLLAALSVLLNVDLSRGWLGLVFFSVVLTLTVERELVRRRFGRVRTRGRMVRRVLIVGRNDEAIEVAESLQEIPSLGYEVVGFVDAEDDRRVIDLRTGHPLGPRLGDPDDVVALARETGVTGVIVATTDTDQGSANQLVRELTREGLFVELTSALKDVAPSRITVRPLGRYPVLCVEPVAAVSWRATAKRAFDVVLASLALVLASPVIAVAALAVRVTSGRGVLFRQERVGRDGRTFTLLKLRTMVPDAEDHLDALQGYNEAAGPMFKMSDDPRVTPVGRWLRRFSVDELPQLWNVVRGDMSLVGPRPALPSEAAQWDDRLRERLRVRPGITGMWQVSGRYTASLETYARLDLFYVDNWSLVADVAILLKTVPVVLGRRGGA